jgi:cold shock CspA family protein
MAFATLYFSPRREFCKFLLSFQSILFTYAYNQNHYGHFFKGICLRPINDTEDRTMPNGTVRWFNRTIGAGFIKTDDGENVLFLNGVIQDSDPCSIHRGARVCLDVLKSQYELTAINVRAAELPE